MAYLGRQPAIGNFVKLDAITAVNGQAAYTMQNGSVNFADYSTVNQFMVSLNGTIQSPGSSFTVSGSTLTFASNLSTGDVIDFIIVFGNSLSAGTPTDGTVTAAKLNDDIISGQTALASEPADTDEFLVSDAGTLKRIDYSLIKGGGITVANTFRMTSDLSVTSSSLSTISSNLEVTDTSGQGSIGSAITESSGIYTFPSTGIYLVEGVFQCVKNGSSQWIQTTLDVTTNNSSYTKVADGEGSISHVASANTSQSIRNSSLVDVTDTSNVKVRFQIAAAQSITLKGNTSYNYTYFNFIRLGDT